MSHKVVEVVNTESDKKNSYYSLDATATARVRQQPDQW